MERMQPLTDALFYVLLALRQPKHGYGIIQEVQELTNGRLVLGAGTLYGAAHHGICRIAYIPGKCFGSFLGT